MRATPWLALASLLVGCNEALLVQPAGTTPGVGLPAAYATTRPATQPSSQLATQPSARPSAELGIQPSARPSSQPSPRPTSGRTALPPPGPPAPLTSAWRSPGPSPVPSGTWGEAIANYVTPTSYGALTPLQGVATERATADRPDDTDLPQVHLIYVVPADQPDHRRDASGSIAGAVGDACQWMIQETGGSTFRVDTFQGKPDISFYRSPHVLAELGDRSDRVLASLIQELRAAGFNDPSKLYHAVLEGSTAGWEDPGTGGFANGNYSGNYHQADDHAMGLTWVHESLHSLGVAHTQGDKTELMSPSGLAVHLDPGHQYYFKLGRPGAFDLATSPYLDPLPPDAVVPEFQPIAHTPGAGAVALDLGPATSTSPVVLDAVTVGNGPCNSLTVAMTVHLLAGHQVSARVSMDGSAYSGSTDLGAKPTTLYASVPRGGQRFVYLFHTVNGDNVLDHRVDLDEQAAWVTK